MSEHSSESREAGSSLPPSRDIGGLRDDRPRSGAPRSLDGVSSFMGLRWEDAQTVRLEIRPELINGGRLLSGVATYAMVDYTGKPPASPSES